ncbi:MAG: TRAP transporter small permease subunit [Gammaproteobacteria bacterium]|nr:TRAP transporter small permease subunit [Gammaproteobacteria bacterium]MDD9800562.1 TRAP transporter small permease subunit [Gammaproteobacteria bacterium]MDD9815572.1 TRAP transporter small permease subunit [Gammaproteobacteria bacterium]MDD9850939.1 TRAP transporter small permease subunit [Gammaproteobacteria bacterium]MDD9870168.1 TRAP transporter small permease subunit [Gammaproteobacteria bacterium]
MGFLRAIAAANTVLLRIGRNAAWAALALMVVLILLQVVFRYVFNNALAWSEEGARFLMLWMAGLVAPSAFRWGGFVAIDIVPRMLPRAASLALAVVLLAVSLAALGVGLQHGYAHTMGFGGGFDSSSLRIPLDLAGLESIKVKLRYMYGSLLVCVVLLMSVNVELIMRAMVKLVAPQRQLPGDDMPADMARAD